MSLGCADRGNVRSTKSSYLLASPLTPIYRHRIQHRKLRRPVSRTEEHGGRLQVSVDQSTMNPRQPASVRRCSRTGCGRASESTLERKQFCHEHFIETCYLRLDEIAGQIKQKELPGCTPEPIQRFLAECAGQVASAALFSRQLNNLQRSRLLEILLFSRDLVNQLRRSERIPRLLPVRLINSRQKETWVEDTVTQNLSKHGAMLRCTHPYAMGETLGLVRLDTGDRAIARVVWKERARFAQHKVAVEILNSTNFWNWQVEARGRV